jgi:formyl-CoA transferase
MTKIEPQPTALGGLKILDFSHVYQGPVGTQILADYGADVIKVERPGVGDWSRSWGPFAKGVSLPFANLNRNKRSVAVNLKAPEGRAFAHRLVKEADVVVHNFRKGVIEKNGLGYEEVRKINPSIVYAWSSGWGDSGPYADSGRGGHDMMARAEAGWFVDMGKGKAPIPGGVSIDYCAGLNLMNAIMMALFHRERTGDGQFVSTDLLSVAFHAHAWEGAVELNADKIDAPAAVGGTEAAILKAFLTSDGAIEISPVFSDNALRDISTGMGLGDLSQDPKFSTEDLQIENQEELNEILGVRFKERPTQAWREELESRGVLCARINSFAVAAKDPQIAVNKMVVQMDHHAVGKLNLLGTPVRLHHTPPTLRLPPPDLGEHSKAVARELGYSDEEIAELVSAGTLAE